MLGDRQRHVHPTDRQPRGDQEEIHRLASQENDVSCSNIYQRRGKQDKNRNFLHFCDISPCFSIHEEFKALKLSDLRIIATLGVGGFGRVELVNLVHYCANCQKVIIVYTI